MGPGSPPPQKLCPRTPPSRPRGTPMASCGTPEVRPGPGPLAGGHTWPPLPAPAAEVTPSGLLPMRWPDPSQERDCGGPALGPPPRNIPPTGQAPALDGDKQWTRGQTATLPTIGRPRSLPRRGQTRPSQGRAPAAGQGGNLKPRTKGKKQVARGGGSRGCWRQRNSLCKGPEHGMGTERTQDALQASPPGAQSRHGPKGQGSCRRR